MSLTVEENQKEAAHIQVEAFGPWEVSEWGTGLFSASESVDDPIKQKLCQTLP